MNEQTLVEKKRNSPPREAGNAKKTRRYTAAEKLKAVRLYTEEGFSQPLVCRELGIGKSTLVLWLQAYRLGGEAGLEPRRKPCRQPKLPAPMTDKIIELKQQNPTFGIKRISQVLRWYLFFTGESRDGAATAACGEAEVARTRPRLRAQRIVHPGLGPWQIENKRV